MTNTLYVKFKNDPSIYTYFVALGNKLSDVIKEIQFETGKYVQMASYDRSKVE